MNNREVSVISTETCPCCSPWKAAESSKSSSVTYDTRSKIAARKRSDKSNPTTSESKSKSAEEGSVKPNTRTTASRSRSTARKKSVKSDTGTSVPKSKSSVDGSFVKSSILTSVSGSACIGKKSSIESEKEKYVLPEIKSKPATNYLDDSQKASNSDKNGSVKANTESLLTTLPTSTTMESSYLQSISKDLSRYVLPEIKNLDNSQKSSNPHENESFTDYMKTFATDLASTASTSSNTTYNNSVQSSTKDIFRYYFSETKKPENSKNKSNAFKNRFVIENTKTSVTCIASTGSSSSNTMVNSSLQSSTKDTYRYVLPEIELQTEVMDYSKKSTNLFKNGSDKGNTKASVDSIASTGSSSRNTTVNSSLQSSTKDTFRYVLPEIKLQTEIMDYSKQTLNSFKNESVAENTKNSAKGMASTTHNTRGNSSFQSSTKDIYRYVLPEIKLPPENNGKKTASDSFKNGSATGNTKVPVTSIASTAYSSSYTKDNSSLQSNTKPAIPNRILPKKFNPLIVQDNRGKNPDPIRTASSVKNIEVTCTSTGPVATCSNSTFGSSFYVLGGDGKLSVIVMDNNGEPTSQFRFRSDGTPEENTHPVNSSQFNKPEMAASVRVGIEGALWNTGIATNSYHTHIEESIKVRKELINLEKMTYHRLTKGSKGAGIKRSTDIPSFDDRMKNHLQSLKDILLNLDEDTEKLREVFQCINSDRALLERTLYTMRNAQLSFAEYTEAFNATQVMNLWLRRAKKLIQMSAEKREQFIFIRNVMMRMLEWL